MFKRHRLNHLRTEVYRERMSIVIQQLRIVDPPRKALVYFTSLSA
jgi:catabolite regulation protein CreA